MSLQYVLLSSCYMILAMLPLAPSNVDKIAWREDVCEEKHAMIEMGENSGSMQQALQVSMTRIIETPKHTH